MKTQRGTTKSYVLVYSDTRDPSRAETDQVLDQLRPLPAEEVLPGTIRVTGSRREVEKCIIDLGQWHLSTEKMFELNPPHKSQLR